MSANCRMIHTIGIYESRIEAGRKDIMIGSFIMHGEIRLSAMKKADPTQISPWPAAKACRIFVANTADYAGFADSANS